jgi:multidrug transporter EmrE-like cation transporter
MKLEIVAALAIAVVGQVLYHVMQKMVSHGAHPVLSLLAFYALAAVMSLPLFWLYPLNVSVAQGLRQLNPAVVGVAVSIVLIELGFLLAYRAGGSLQSSYFTSAAVTTCVLVLIGAVAYAERLDMPKIAGLLLCLCGIWLLSRQPAP